MRDGAAVGPIVDGDSVVFFNFRGDRAIEISRAFTEPDFDEFDRERCPEVSVRGDDGVRRRPADSAALPGEPPAISRTVSEYLVHNGVSQLADGRNPEVRPRHLLLERQQLGEVRHRTGGVGRGAVRRRSVRDARRP